MSRSFDESVHIWGANMRRVCNSRSFLFFVLLMILLAAFPSAISAQGLNPHLVVNTSRLNIRSGPGVSHAVITSVPGGTVLPVTGIDNGRVWFQVTSPVGEGWVNSTYAVDRGNFRGVPILNSGVVDQPSVAPGTPHLVVNTYRLNVRSGPGVSYARIGTVAGGDELPVIAIDRNGVWYQVETTFGAGWVNRTYGVQRGNFASIPRVSTATDTGPTFNLALPHLVINTAYLNVRSGPGVGYDIVTTVRGGTKLQVSAISSENRLWMQVTTDAGVGWVNSYYAVRRGNFGSLTQPAQPVDRGAHLTGLTPRVVVNTHRLNIRSGPGVSHPVITSVPGGTTLAVLGITRNRSWYQVEGSFGQGWLNGGFAVFRGEFSLVPYVG